MYLAPIEKNPKKWSAQINFRLILHFRLIFISLEEPDGLVASHLSIVIHQVVLISIAGEART